jgi:hypothetical protein
MTPEEISAEVDRLLATRDARRAAAALQRDAYVREALKTRLERFRAGTLGMCDCRACLAVYISHGGDISKVSLMCPEGQRQFWFDASWHPWMP